MQKKTCLKFCRRKLMLSSIIIVAESLISESKKCHNVFSMLEKEELFSFNDLQEIHILDLSRIKNEKKESLSDWLNFINSEEEEEFMAVAQKNKFVNEAFDRLKVISADKTQRILYEARLKEQRDIRSITGGAERKRTQEIAKKMKEIGMDADTISKVTGLFVDDILRL